MNIAVPTPVSLERFDASSLAARINQAQHLFAAGDMRAAMIAAEAVYDEAKAAHGFAARMKASEGVIASAHAMVVEALEIGSLAKVALANEYDQAQAAGLVARKGRPKNVPGEDILQLSHFGIDRRVILDARKLRNAEIKNPGLIRSTIAGLSAEGILPTKSNLRAAIGTASASKEQRGDNFYQTPDVATLTLLAHESFSSTIWEPACGHNAVGRVLEAQGYNVILSDLVDRGTISEAGDVQSVGDFLFSVPDPEGEGPDIVTNPPYGEVLNAFVAHILKVHKPRKVALLLNLNFLAGFADDDRNFVMDECPPARVYVFKRRLPMMHREGYEGPKSSSRMNTAWFVWERQEDGSYGDTTVIRRVDWADFVDSDSLEPGEGGHCLSIRFDDAPRTTPRRELHERVDIERDRARDWIAGRADFSRAELCGGIGIRDTTGEALIAEFVAAGVISAASGAGRSGRHAVTAGSV
ncbi:Mlr8507 protein [Neorhizobium galegae bv. officinalis]|nr:Mlr8507 protein [Neorhizobium galegae bv. officinalis]